jgi:hypothetical protein
LWNDQSGGVITAEMTLVMSILVLGLIGGLQAVRDSTVGELEGIARRIQEVGSGAGIPSSAARGEADNLVVGGQFDVPLRGGQFRSMFEGQYIAPSQCVITAESEQYWASVRR